MTIAPTFMTVGEARRRGLRLTPVGPGQWVGRYPFPTDMSENVYDPRRFRFRSIMGRHGTLRRRGLGQSADPPAPWFAWAMALGIGMALIYALLPPERLPPRPKRRRRRRRPR